jgi:hypothetical protein
MFLVNDSIESRRKMIEGFLDDCEPSIALLLAVIDMERTLRRAILALGTIRTKELNARMGVRKGKKDRRPNSKPAKGPLRYRSNLDGLNEAWRAEVQPYLEPERKLPYDLCSDWDTVLKAVKLRHELVHGARGPTSGEFAVDKVRAVLDFTASVDTFCKTQGHDLRKPVRRRLKDRV